MQKEKNGNDEVGFSQFNPLKKENEIIRKNSEIFYSVLERENCYVTLNN